MMWESIKQIALSHWEAVILLPFLAFLSGKVRKCTNAFFKHFKRMWQSPKRIDQLEADKLELTKQVIDRMDNIDATIKLNEEKNEAEHNEARDDRADLRKEMNQGFGEIKNLIIEHLGK